MQRVTLTLDDDLVEELERFIAARGYASRSEAVRDIVRAGFQQLGPADRPVSASCAAALVYVYERDTRELARRLSDLRADNHDLVVATTSVDLDHKSCLEVTVLRGETSAVQQVGDHVVVERGVMHGKLVVIPVDVARESHPHGHGHGHAHDHFKVRHGG